MPTCGHYCYVEVGPTPTVSCTVYIQARLIMTAKVSIGNLTMQDSKLDIPIAFYNET